MSKIHKLMMGPLSGHTADGDADDYILCGTTGDDPNFSSLDKFVDCKKCLSRMAKPTNNGERNE